MKNSVSRSEYRHLLFRTAVLVMACDGEIHADEIQELLIAHQRTNYFSGIDFDVELSRLRDQMETDKQAVIRNYFEVLSEHELDPVQQLQLLELALRIVYADQRVHENEKRFCQMIQRVLRIPEPIMEQRFGSVSFISSTSHGRKIKDGDLVTAIADQLSLPTMEDLKVIED